ncbi:conserved exported hypothetical protein [Pseudomonas sp. 8AS]|uniref:hypothetical protein n=1 Tax=Pseudomonas sp. 8AS TaxID=2653163 RepID=UPI0012F410E3|nr:hypothetical protein [Pseudomonas sp. 8AS]VXB73957.1 conserved exported hypothetical protein [Pseudomonas sp. 8AS]
MKILRMGMLALIACLVTLSSLAQADEVPLITGEHWMESSEQLKKVYLIGIANAYQVEAAYHASKPPADDQSLIPRFSKGLKGHTLDSVREGLNRWYAANPDQVKRPVIETIWFEMVLPGLQ